LGCEERIEALCAWEDSNVPERLFIANAVNEVDSERDRAEDCEEEEEEEEVLGGGGEGGWFIDKQRMNVGR